MANYWELLNEKQINFSTIRIKWTWFLKVERDALLLNFMGVSRHRIRILRFSNSIILIFYIYCTFILIFSNSIFLIFYIYYTFNLIFSSSILVIFYIYCTFILIFWNSIFLYSIFIALILTFSNYIFFHILYLLKLHHFNIPKDSVTFIYDILFFSNGWP